jgi:hypothetical protein
MRLTTGPLTNSRATASLGGVLWLIGVVAALLLAFILVLLDLHIIPPSAAWVVFLTLSYMVGFGYVTNLQLLASARPKPVLYLRSALRDRRTFGVFGAIFLAGLVVDLLAWNFLEARWDLAPTYFLCIALLLKTVLYAALGTIAIHMYAGLGWVILTQLRGGRILSSSAGQKTTLKKREKPDLNSAGGMILARWSSRSASSVRCLSGQTTLRCR